MNNPTDFQIIQLQLKKDILHNRISEQERHLRTVKAMLDLLHTERVLTEQAIKKNVDKAQKLAEQIDEFNYNKEKKGE